MRRTMLAAGALAVGLAAAGRAEGHDHPLVGAWEVGDGRTLTILPEGYAVGAFDNVAMLVFAITMEGDTIVISERVPPPGAEPCESAGTYGWAVEDDRLEFTAIEDACTARAQSLDGARFTRRATSAPPTVSNERDEEAGAGTIEGDDATTDSDG